MQAEFDRLARVVEAIEVEVLDGRVTGVTVAENEGGARDLVRGSERPRGRRDEGRFSAAEVPFEGDDVARSQRAGESFGSCNEGGEVGRFEPLGPAHAVPFLRQHRFSEEVRRREAKALAMWWRANDVVVGVITGVFSAVVAALFEAFFVTSRFLSLGQHGGGIGSKLAFIAVVGAIVGGLVGFFVGAVIKPRPQTR